MTRFFCRITQMGPRLLTHETVMRAEVLSSREAWSVYQTLMRDELVQLAPEPSSLEPEWRRLTPPRLWTDAYWAVFARAVDMRLVTLDRAIASLTRETLLRQTRIRAGGC